MKYLQITLLVLLVTISCKEKPAEVEKETTPKVEVVKKESPKVVPEDFVKQSVDDDLANKIKTFLINDYLKDDMAVINDSDRKFQMYKIDLNKDGKEEIFVRFMTPYFCGTGGCTFLLLNNEQTIITKFSVTKAPIWAEQTLEKGWKVLMTPDGDRYRMLKFDGKTYPSNPSLAEKTPENFAPSGHAEIMFDNDFSNCKTYSF